MKENLMTKCRCGKETICENCDMCKCGHKKTDHKKVGVGKWIGDIWKLKTTLSCQVITVQLGKDGRDICECREYDKDLKDQRTLFQ